VSPPVAFAPTAPPAAAEPVSPLPEPPATLDAGAEAQPPSLEASEGTKREASGRTARPVVAPAKEIEESLQQAQQLLHAQRYDEARAAFEKLLAVKPAKGAASAGLAKIAFQEKDYKQAAERAKESAKLGGGVEARVLLGDAYFKLEKFEEAKKAYNEALKLDPNNRVAGQGLRLLESQEEPPK
jgi:tetratricopeptide (TPR) repeat protein